MTPNTLTQPAALMDFAPELSGASDPALERIRASDDTGMGQFNAYVRDLRLALGDRDRAAKDAAAARRMCLQLTQGLPALMHQHASALHQALDALRSDRGGPGVASGVALHAIGATAEQLVHAATSLAEPLTQGHDPLPAQDIVAQDGAPLASMEETWRRLDRAMRALTHERAQSATALEKAQIDGLRRLISAAELKDDDTGAHIRRMGFYSALIARSCGLHAQMCDTLLYASRMHDVGKIGIPDSILQKRGPLDDAEWQVMRKHPEIGATLLRGANTPLYDMAAEVALAHHERFDGTGYPNGWSGTQIPLTARIVALADFFDALTMDRCYRVAFSDDKALALIREGCGTHFDPEVVDAFFRCLPELIAVRGEVNAGLPVSY